MQLVTKSPAFLQEESELRRLLAECSQVGQTFAPQHLPEQYDATFCQGTAPEPRVAPLWRDVRALLQRLQLNDTILPPLPEAPVTPAATNPGTAPTASSATTAI